MTQKRKKMLQLMSINRRWAIERDLPQPRLTFNARQNGARYILVDHGDFVESVEPGDTATIKTHFTFTSDPAKACVFSYADLYDKNATNAIGIAFAAGFGGRVIRVDKGTTA